MKELMRSFVAGIGSVLSIYPQTSSGNGANVVEIIGADFSRIGSDLAKAMNARGATLSRSEMAPNGKEEGKAEQLTFNEV